jgi:2-polyprenyl-3-methyl-5-hydroxy-6-metoxy-1,4-benzoquinol methylase
MKIYYDLKHIDSYINEQRLVRLEDLELQFEKHLRRIKRFKEISSNTRMLEIGTGSGWFPILCKKFGIDCEGLEICPQLVEYAKQFGQAYGIEPAIRLGNIEEEDIGRSTYDVIIALSTFEHVEHWQKGIKKIYNALRPDGLFYFYSTNKFSLRSGEYNLPLYGWLPNSLRYRLRIFRQGEDIMKLGIDFNQFTYPQLRKFFKSIGFSKHFDLFDIVDSDNLIKPKLWKEMTIKMVKRFKPLKYFALFFSTGTLFICQK